LQGPVLQAAAAEGPGSKEQQQLHGLLRSVIKWAGVMGPDQQPLTEQLRAAVAVAAANLLLAGSRAQEAGAAADAVAAASSTATADDIASSSAAVSSRHGQDGSTEQPAQHSIAQHVQVAASPGPKATSSSAAVLSHLPWLGVLGCCCLQWSQQLASLPTDNHAAAAAAAQSGVPHRAKGVISLLPEGLQNVWGSAAVEVDNGLGLICLCIHTAVEWLEAELTFRPEMIAQWVAPFHLHLFLAAASGCLRAQYRERKVILEHPDDPMPLAGYAQQLAALGEALCAVTHKQSCNNPSCGNISGPSELQLVKGRSNTCSRCRTARYCSPECMRQHWKQHRPVCKALGRPAAAAATAASAPATDVGPQAEAAGP
jgi:hypothetical protein